MLETYILKTEKYLGKDDFERLLGYVSEEKKERIHRFHRFEDAQRTLLGDVLARYAICKRTGENNKDLVFCTNEYGKPLLLEPIGIHFNISHSGNWVVCVVDDNPVGIDIELIKPINFKITERFFSQDEYTSLINQPEAMRLKYFYMIWTLKESYIKAKGKGLSIPLNSFNIKIGRENIFCCGMRKYNFCQSFLGDDTVYSICTMDSTNSDSINWDIGQFLKNIHYMF
jgi:4'-phosphopantetheinyl transferase